VRVDVGLVDARGEQQAARDREVGSARGLDRVLTQAGDAVDVLRSLDDRGRVLLRGAQEQRAVDVEQQ
jgi:hypothetical protein